MRRTVLAALAAALLAPVAVEAAPPKPGCRPVLTDPLGDTYEGLHHEPAADLTAITLRSTAKTLTLGTTFADVDAPLVAAPGGRKLRVEFAVGESTTFRMSWVQGLDKTRAELAVTGVHREAGGLVSFTSGGSAVGDVAWSIDARSNQVRVELPLALLRKYVGVTKGTQVRVGDVDVHDVQGFAETHNGITMDDSRDSGRSWRIGDC